MVYKTFQATGGAVSWRINALQYAAMTQFIINWSLVGASLAVAIPSVLAINSLTSSFPTESPEEDEH
ncbi:hypothetical protein V5O48_013080 [Marasmius crinis-equi]|uniref:Uncharacterized protein n=1 Tax=Marasmius crinis-equi TaxID=585013 RepID=A0ABR3F124_9AGAR